jgi:hypothetical protein
MNVNTVQSSWCAYQTQLNQGMASTTRTQDSTEFIDLEVVGRQPILSQCLESYPREQKGMIHPNRENNLVERSNQEAMICLADFRKHPNGELIAHCIRYKGDCSLR